MLVKATSFHCIFNFCCDSSSIGSNVCLSGGLLVRNKFYRYIAHNSMLTQIRWMMICHDHVYNLWCIIGCMFHTIHISYNAWCMQCNMHMMNDTHNALLLFKTSIGHSVTVIYNSKLCQSVLNCYRNLDAIMRFLIMRKVLYS